MKSSSPGRVVSVAAAALFCLSLVCSLPGCGGAGKEGPTTPRVAASGKVEFDGKPLPAGTVTFRNHATGNTAICEISNGKYSCSADEGPNPGANVVTVMGMAKAGADPMWARPWSKQVEVGQTDFSEDFSIPAGEVQPFDPASVQVDE